MMNQPLIAIRHKTAYALLVSLILLMMAPRAEAQMGDAGEILRAGTHDANLLMENYLKPFGAGFGADLNSGWVNNARAYRPMGFDLRVNAAVSLVPEADRSFSVAQLALTEMEHRSGSSVFTPTISGDDFSNTELVRTFQYEDSQGNMVEEELFSFVMPQGSGFPYVPAPMVQLTVGLVKDTDLSIRYIPTVDIQDVGGVSMWGLGVKHGINQWLPGGTLLPVDISVQAGYTQLDANASFDVEPDIDGQTHVPQGYGAASSHWNGQGIELSSSGFTGNILVGKTLPILSLYGGVGFQTASMNIKTPGNYPLIVPNDDYNPSAPANSSNGSDKPKTIESLNRPLDLDLDGENNFHAMAGVRIRLAILTISGSYTLAKYPTANVGVGISLR